MRLDKTMTAILVKIDPTFTEFALSDGSSDVEPDKALSGTTSFEPHSITITLHVDNIFCTASADCDIDGLEHNDEVTLDRS